MTIEESDKLIAEFDLGKKFNYNVRKNGVWKEGRFYYWKDVKYHSSWDWLMPVGEKIFEYLQKAVKERPPHTCTEGDFIEIDITCAIREYNRPEAYKHIVRWIQWYNTQNTQQ